MPTRGSACHRPCPRSRRRSPRLGSRRTAARNRLARSATQGRVRLDRVRWLEVRRHAFTAKGDRRGEGSELSSEGVRAARSVGEGIGEVAHVVTSRVRRTSETALAMGLAVDEIAEMASGYIAGEVGHHEQWAWTQPYVRYAALLQSATGVTACAHDQLQLWLSTVRRVPDGGVGLVISHGGIIEPTLVAALPEADHAAWGAVFAHLDGARLSFHGDRFTAVEFRRATPQR